MPNIRYFELEQPTADNSWTGVTAILTAGTALAFPNVVYFGSDGKMELIDANAAATMPAVAIACGTIAENATGIFLLLGFIRYSTWTWTPGDWLYASALAAGGIVSTAPAGSGDQVQVIGRAMTSDVILFQPSPVLVEIT
jgi:hypothetical protein